MAFALRGLDRPRSVAGQFGDFAKADFNTGNHGVVRHQRGHLRAGEYLVEMMQSAQIDQLATWRELVEAQALEAGTGSFRGGGQACRPRTDDD